MTNATAPAWLASYPDNVDWNAPLPAQSLPALLDASAERFADRPAMQFLGRKFTYAELNAHVKKIAGGLKSLGIQRGVKVGICLPNCPFYVIAYYAILRTGATVVNFSPLASSGEIARQIEDSGTEVMVTLNLNLLLPKVQPALETTRLKQIIVCSLAEAMPALKSFGFRLLKRAEIADFPRNDPRYLSWDQLLSHKPLEALPSIAPESDIAVLQYTGGTTGTPKGVVLTHANCSINALQSRLWFAEAQEGEERIIAVLPLFHVFAMTTILNFGILIGAELLLHPRFEIKTVLKDIAKSKATLMPGVSTLFNAINQCPELRQYNLTSLKYCISGGGPLPQAIKAEFENLTGCVLVEGYGLSEASPVTCCNPLRGENRSGTIGLPLPGTIMEIIDKEDPTRLLPAGEEGEICIRGPQVMQGYWQNLEETRGVLRPISDDSNELRLHTGDIGVMEEDGYFRVVDRLKELIITSGFNVYPRNVEEALYRHEAVQDAAIIGVPDPKRAEAVKAFIVIKPGYSLTQENLIEFLKNELPPYAIPRLFDFRAELPKTMVGKIDKKPLRAEG